jgi:pimeloyl-ACP methyl ester carboxylesterase
MIANDLHAVLKQAGIEGPIVLVGHSIGGEYVRIYTAKFPSQVAGLVLVDSTHPDQREPAMMLSPVTRMSTPARRTICGLLPLASRFGLIRFVLRNTAVDAPTEFSSRQSEAVRALRDQRVKGFETEAVQGCAATKGGSLQAESGSGDIEVDEAARRAGGLGSRPLVVLTAGQYWKPDGDPLAAQQISEFHRVWVNQLQAALAKLSTDGKQVVVENSDHGIPGNAPEAVVKAVREVVRARADENPEPRNLH